MHVLVVLWYGSTVKQHDLGLFFSLIYVFIIVVVIVFFRLGYS